MKIAPILNKANSESESLVHKVLDHSADGIIVLNDATQVVYVNKAAEVIFGRPASKFLLTEFGFPVKTDEAAEVNIFRQDGGHRTVELKSNPFVLNNEDCIVVSLRDISDRKILERKLTQREQYTTNLMNNMPDCIITLDESGAILGINFAVTRILGYKEEQLCSKHITELFCEESFVKWLEGSKRKFGISQPDTNADVRCIHSNSRFLARQDTGQNKVMELSINVMKAASTNVLILNGRDISDKLATESRLEVISQALTQSLLAKMIFSTTGEIEFTNDTFNLLYGLTKDAANGENARKLLSDHGIEVNLDTNFIGNGIFSEEYLEAHDSTDAGVWLNQYVSPIRSHEGIITHLMVSQEDITAKIELQRKLDVIKVIDEDTGLLNRNGFKRQLASRGDAVDKRLRILLLNIDHFTAIRDVCGDYGSSVLLKSIAGLIQEELGNDERVIIARLNADSFQICLDDTLSELESTVKNLKCRIEDFKFCWEENLFNPTCTIAHRSITAAELQSQFDKVLRQLSYASKLAQDRGGNQVVAADSFSQDVARLQGDAEGVGIIHRALENNLFCLFQQPITTLDKGAEVRRCYEVLIRLRNGEQFVSPAKFLPAAEKYKLMHRIDHWVISHLMTWLGNNPEHTNQLSHCGVNLSGDSLLSADMIAHIEHSIESNHIDPKKICVEITETAAVHNFFVANAHIKRLRDFGCTVALDDFGAGMCSLTYLKMLGIDYLKIDGAFIRDLQNNPIDFAMVNAIINLSKYLGLKTIAEFVENQETESLLRLIGIDYVQGYHIGKPVLLC